MKKYVIVTGAGSGIGKEICSELKKRELFPIALGRRPEPLKEASNDFLSLDLSNKESGTKLNQFLKEKLGSEDQLVGLINNAGIYSPSSFEENKMEDWYSQFETNLFGAVRITHACLEYLKKASEGSAAVLNISSTLGIRPIENTSAYSASKAAMNNWTLSLALELSKYKIRVNSICPGIVETPIHDFDQTDDKELRATLNQMQPLGRIGQPQDIAPMAAHLVSSESSWTTGGIFNIDGGILLKS